MLEHVTLVKPQWFKQLDSILWYRKIVWIFWPTNSHINYWRWALEVKCWSRERELHQNLGHSKLNNVLKLSSRLEHNDNGYNLVEYCDYLLRRDQGIFIQIK